METSTQASFSRRRRWSIAFHVGVALVAVLALVVMLNYLSGRVSKRYYVSSHQRSTLSPRTISILHSLTNQVQITLYYEKDADIYSSLVDLLKEYRANSGKIRLRFVDYLRETAAAQEVSARYDLGSATNLVIFSCEGKRPWIISGDELMQMKLVFLGMRTNGLAFERQREAFRGEVAFSGALLAVTDPKPFKAYYLQGDGEHGIDDSKYSYRSFVGILQQNLIHVQPLWLLGTNSIPTDCDLLIVAGPRTPILPPDVKSIERYLDEGGRLLALFNIASTNTDIGLENVLTNWGIQVSKSQVLDRQFANPEDPGSVLVLQFSRHPAVNPLNGHTVEFLLPRMISQCALPSPAGDGVKVDEIIRTGPASYLVTAPEKGMTNVPIAVAVEQGVRKERGATRILVVGDSIFLSDPYISLGANREFASLAANWLLERDALLEGIGPKPVEEFRLLMTGTQMQTARWVLLAAMPGGVLLFGGLIWLRRRK